MATKTEPNIARVCATWQAHRALHGSVSEGPGGRFVRNRVAPDVWDANHVGDVRAESPAEIDALLAAADRHFAGFDHRMVLCDPETPPGVAARLVLAGYAPDVNLQLVLEGALAAKASREVAIRAVTRDEDAAHLARLLRADHVDEAAREGRAPYDAGLSRRMADLRLGLREAGVRLWLAEVDGQTCGSFSSWLGPVGLGMVEWLFCDPAVRRRGVATSLIAHCVDDLRRQGAEGVLIGAATDPYDVPRRLYASLGFEPTCLTTQYTLLTSADPAS